jgi:RNA polymerase sigma-70 factor (ECF subfamily)
MDEATDEQLLEGFRSGDSGAFERLYARYRQPLYRFLLHMCGSSADADELFQDLWMRVIHASDSFRGGSFKAWLFRIARNLQIDLQRRRHLRPVANGSDLDRIRTQDAGPERRVQEEDCARRLLRAIAALPVEQREAFLLKQETDMRLDAIATLVNVGRETIKSRLRYAMKHLRTTLEDCL